MWKILMVCLWAQGEMRFTLLGSVSRTLKRRNGAASSKRLMDILSWSALNIWSLKPPMMDVKIYENESDYMEMGWHSIGR